MATKPRSIRKFERQWSKPPDMMTVDVFQKAGYHIVYKYDLQPFKLKQWRDIMKWCDENFNHKHWVFKWEYWMFTHEKDAFLFKLTWS